MHLQRVLGILLLYHFAIFQKLLLFFLFAEYCPLYFDVLWYFNMYFLQMHYCLFKSDGLTGFLCFLVYNKQINFKNSKNLEDMIHCKNFFQEI